MDDAIKKILDILNAVHDLEMIMADFYLACSETWPEESGLWMELAVDEENHGSIVVRLMEIIEGNPDHFQADKPLEISAVQSYILAVRDKMRDILSGGVALDEALRFAEGMETSLVESRFIEVVTSTSSRFGQLSDLLVRESEKHRQRLEQRLAGLKD